MALSAAAAVAAVVVVVVKWHTIQAALYPLFSLFVWLSDAITECFIASIDRRVACVDVAG